ncbi:MAG: hypothetical protein PHT77_01470 [Bacteroidales bacterium]|nr:hypothetical protein [Bacteroidales bacterium]
MPIKMAPEDFYEAFMIGNYNEFNCDSSSVMKAFNSAVAASHLADCYCNYHKVNNPELIQEYPNLSDFIEFIHNRTGNYFRDIRSISNAYKHLYTGLSDNYARHSSISSSGTIETIVFENEEIKQLEEDFSKNIEPETKVVYTRKNGEQIDFLYAIDRVKEFWDNIFYNQ